MPRAGWCRECGEWIWVDEEGACQNGHGSECVDFTYETVPHAIESPFGGGEFPRELDRFNWGAFFVPAFWAVAYGTWPILFFWLFTLLLPIFLLMITGSFGQTTLEASIVGVTVISQFAEGVMRLWAGANANAMLWKRETLRLDVVEGSRPRFSLERFVARQRTWTIIGAVIMVLSIAGVVMLAALPGASGDQLREQVGVASSDAVLALVWAVAEFVLALWLAGKMRADRHAAAPDPQDAA